MRTARYVFSLDKDSPRKALRGRDDALIDVGTLFVGVNIEKGYGPQAALLGPPRPKPEERLGPLWVWHTLVDGDGPTQFGRTLAALSRSVTTHLYVISSTGPDDVASKYSKPRDAVLFSCSPSGIKSELDNGLPENVLNRHDMSKATSFEALANGLRKVDDHHWVDLYAGSYIPKGEVDIGELDQKVLSYFEHWVKSGYPPRGQRKPAVRV